MIKSSKLIGDIMIFSKRKYYFKNTNTSYWWWQAYLYSFGALPFQS